MLVYILKSVACLAIFFAFYKLFLEKENMHRFKRFYLLGALLSSLLIPLVIFTEYVEVTPLPEIQLETMQTQTTEDVINIPPALEDDVIDFAPILWGIYFVGLFFFGLKFIINLFQILGRIRKNPKNKLARFTQVLLLEKLPPHTFFKYIFLNKTKFESNQIPKEVLLHEETHAAQKHSIDVVFVELLQVIFWVNPFIYFAKKAMKLNHEFLADQAVLQNNIDATSYKNTLLSYLSPDSQYTQEPQMANSINYSSIKKRFTVMKTQTSKKAALLRSLVILPLLALMIYGFSTKNIDYKTSSTDDYIINDFVLGINSDGEIIFDDKIIPFNDISVKVKEAYKILTNGERVTFVTGHIFFDEKQLELLDEVLNQLGKVGFRDIKLVSKQTASITNPASIIPSIYDGKTIAEARDIRKKSIDSSASLWFDIKNENEIWFKNEQIHLENLASFIETHTKNEDDNLEVHFYVLGTIHYNLLNKINKEASKVNVSKILVTAEEYIISESEFIKEGINADRAKIHLKTSLLTSEQKPELIQVNINKHGRILVQDDLTTLEELDSFITKLISTFSEDKKLEKVTSIIYMDNESPEKIVSQVYEILSKYSDPSIQPMESDFFKKSKDDLTEKEITPFTITVEKNKNAIRLKCETGCKWAHIALDTKTKSKYIINDFGFSEGKTLDTDKFAFTIEPTTEGVALISLKGTAWVDLSFSIGENNSRRINHEGVWSKNQLNAEIKESKLTLRYDKKGRLYLNNKTILFENLLEKLGNVDFIEINKFTKAHIHAQNASDTKINELIRVLWDAGITAENVGVISEIPTKKQIEEYNTLAKKYNTIFSKNKSVQIKRKDVERLQYIYSLMSDKQKKKVEPFPDFPEPPPLPQAPPAPNTSKVKNGEKNSQWVVSSGAKRDSRKANNSITIPPTLPTIGLHVDKGNYSKKLKKAIDKFLESTKKYEKDVDAYKKEVKVVANSYGIPIIQQWNCMLPIMK